MPGIFAVIGVILLILAGLDVAGPRFSPGWLGLGFVSLALLWAPIAALG
jgi:hypothetical protein